MTPATILDRAAQILEPAGAWCQGSFGSDGCHCLLGAIAEAGGDTGSFASAISTIDRLTGGCITFNDTPGRTQGEVVAMLREAAQVARSEEMA